MIQTWLYSILRVINPRLFPYVTFSYYIPAPPKRTSGYREKEFDRQLFSYIQAGHRLVSLQCQSHNTEVASGVWMVATLQSTIPRKNLLLEDNQFAEAEENCEVDGLYYIKD